MAVYFDDSISSGLMPEIWDFLRGRLTRDSSSTIWRRMRMRSKVPGNLSGLVQLYLLLLLMTYFVEIENTSVMQQIRCCSFQTVTQYYRSCSKYNLTSCHIKTFYDNYRFPVTHFIPHVVPTFSAFLSILFMSQFIHMEIKSRLGKFSYSYNK